MNGFDRKKEYAELYIVKGMEVDRIEELVEIALSHSDTLRLIDHVHDTTERVPISVVAWACMWPIVTIFNLPGPHHNLVHGMLTHR